jgi:dienelactone hydrolase
MVGQRLLKALLVVGMAGSLVAAPASVLAEVIGESFVYEVDGVAFEGYVARDAHVPESRGTVLIVHDWDGLNAYEMLRAEMLAAEGYTAFAIDVYGQGVRPTTMDENRRLAGSMYRDRETFRKRLLGALDAVSDLPGGTGEVVAMGYCFGGAAVLEMARAGALTAGFVSFHGGLGLPEGQSYDDVTAPVLLLHGSADPVSGMTDLAALLDQLQGAGVPHEARVYGGARHAFTVYDSTDYDLAADRGSWSALLNFLDQQLGVR